MPDTLQDRDMDTRTLEIRAATIDDETRSVEAVLATENRVEMVVRGELIEEILRTDTINLPKQVPLLNAHKRQDADDVLGSIRSIRLEGSDIVGRLHFASDDKDVDKIWNKVRQGHITDVSIGYRRREIADVRPGGTETIVGRTYTAGDRHRLVVVTNWSFREGSLLPIGADDAAQLRNEQLTTGADSMADEHEKQEREALELAERKAEAERKEREANERAEAEKKTAEDGERIRKEAAEGERARIVELRKLAGDDVTRELLDQAIAEGWDDARASTEFLAHVRSSRGTGPGIHSRSHESDCNTRSLAAGLLAGQGLDPVGKRVGPKTRELMTEQDADRGHEYRALSAIDICRECVRMDGKTPPREYDELVRVAMSGTHLDRVFTTNVYARLIAGWEETPDTTGWCQSEDVPNFMTQEDITLRQNSALDRHPRGATAKHADFSDDYETYAVARYSKQFVADEQDFIDDRLGALMQVPQEMGGSARRLHPDLVYSVMLENPTLTATAGALFNATAESTAGGHANQTTAALAAAGLKAALIDMRQKRLDGVPLNIRATYLIVPPDLDFTAKEILNSGELRDTTTNTLTMNLNVLSQENLTPVVEARLDATGVTDPRDQTARTGSATNWFLAADRRTIKKLYLRGAGRMPQLRSFTLDKGQWGMGWDIKHDAGAAAVDFRGLHKSTGAG